MELRFSITAKGSIFEGKAPEILNHELTAAMWEAVLLLEGEVKKNTPQGVFGTQGGLVSTIHGEVEGKGTPVVKGIVGHQSKYGDVIEKGRQPNKRMPPEGSLLRWIEVKLGKDPASAKAVEFLIRRKIGKKGFPGARMFETSLTINEVKIRAIFERRGFTMTRKIDAE